MRFLTPNLFKFIKSRSFLLLILVFTSCSKDYTNEEIEEKVEIVEESYISKVFEFSPSVGQFTNVLPKYEVGDTQETMRQKAEDAIKGKNPMGMVSLGGFGGYIVFGFNHTIENKKGLRDFRVVGNAFWAAGNPNSEASPRGGSSEPGIIMVSVDENKNGLPDDRWYEIAGSAHNEALKNYEITFYRPSPNKTPIKDENISYTSDIEYIRWTDNQGNSGYKKKNIYHSQNYFPEWLGDKITFRGTLLPNNGVDESGTGSYWVLYSFGYGYVDNAPNNDDASAIDIDWAVDDAGNKVNLPEIDFVKVYNGMNQECGWLGETSTEIAGAYDLHSIGITIKSE